jgi:tetratricopeptide (TPR) repeat protein
MKHAPVVAFALAIFLASTASAQSIPERAIAAEGAGDWDTAVRLYQDELGRNPKRGDLWLRIADIEARRGNPAEAIAALQSAAAVQPGDASISHRLSQAYAAANHPEAALSAIRGALALAPDDPNFLLDAATLATWAGDYGFAARAYRRLQETGGAIGVDIDLNLARVSAWAGETDRSVSAYRRYLTTHPLAAEIWLELARTEAWRGNYAAALEALRTYRDRFGETDPYLAELASTRARSGQPTEAITLVDPLIERNPTSHGLKVTRTLALAAQQRPRETFDELRSIRRLNPSARETRATASVVRASLSSTAEPEFSVYSDSDQMQVIRMTPSIHARFSTRTQLSAGYERQILEAPTPGGLGRADGRAARFEYGWAALTQTFGPLTLEGQIGAATADERKRVPYELGVSVRPSDSLHVAASSNYGFFVVSPKTVELGLTARQHHVEIDWAPGVLYRLSATGSYERLSDGNVRWQALVAPRRAVTRRQSWNFDLGASAYMLATKSDLPNGYYDPRRYESYSITAYPYFKLSENAGLGLAFAAGVQREQRLPTFRFGGNASAELTIGIYQPWVVKGRASATNNQRAESGAFKGYSVGVVLVRRF